jgi:hypothetical protein
VFYIDMTVYSTLTVDLQSVSPPGGFGPALVTLTGNGFVDLGGPLCRFQNGTVEVTVVATINSDIESAVVAGTDELAPVVGVPGARVVDSAPVETGTHGSGGGGRSEN